MGNNVASFIIKFFLLILLQTAIALPVNEKVRYDNYTVYRLTPNNENALKTLQNWFMDRLEFDFWSPIGAIGAPVDVMVPPHYKTVVDNLKVTDDISSSVLISNVQDHIDNEGFRPVSAAGTFDFTHYHTLEEIYKWLNDLVAKYPGKLSLINIGKTYEKRDLLVVKLSFKNVSQKAVFIESNIHAREWISGAVNAYILNELLTSTNETIRHVAESHDWYVLVIANPDGFVYTHTTTRLWRKTRVPYASGCYGADPNRNWNFEWGHGGTSTNPCSEIYQGPSPFSEPCTKVLSTFISTISKELVAYIDFHSYSQLLLLPYGHTPKHLDNFDQMYAVGLKAKAALARRYGTTYVVGDIAETIYIASGSSVDWVKGTYHTPIVFAYELRDRGIYGFLLPANQIIPTGEETLDSLLTILIEGEKAVSV